MAKTIMKLGNIPVVSGAESIKRLAILLWGPAAVGKSTFAATAPGTKLWLSIGDNEHASVAHRKDVLVADLAGLGLDEFFNQLEGSDPFGLDRLLAENQSISTVVVDSATSLAYNCLLRAVDKKVGAGKDFVPTIMAPGLSAYGGRNGLVLKALTGFMRVTSKHGVHIIITGHESDPDMKHEGGKELIDKISIMLGGQIVNNVSLRLSEIWYMSQSEMSGQERKIAIRPTRRRRPMKTRMFSDIGDPEFVLRYDANKPDKGQMTIESWYDQWLKEGARIKIPGSRK